MNWALQNHLKQTRHLSGVFVAIIGTCFRITVMSKKIKKIYLPKWQLYFILPLFLIIWLFVTYMEFFSTDAGEIGVLGFAFFSFIFIFAGGMIYLMTTGRLPAYTMEEENEDESTDQ